MERSQLTRREAIELGAVACGAQLVTGCTTVKQFGASSYSGYIDAHSHIWTPDTERFPLGPWANKDQMKPPSFTAEQLLAIAEESGVDRVVLIQHAPYYGDDSRYLVECARHRHPGRFSIVAIVEERRDDLDDHLRRLKRQGVRGIRIGPGRYADRTLVKDPDNWLKAPAMRNLWKLATNHGLILCPLIGARHIPTLDPMLLEFPDTTVVIDHFGHAHADRPEEVEALLKLARHPHCHVKVSGFYKFGDRKAPYDDLAPIIARVNGAYGPDRLMWGSDCPYQLRNGNNYHDAVRLIESGLGFLDAAARSAILRDTAGRLFS